MKNILVWLIDSSIIASIIILIVLLIRPFIKRLPKWVNLVLWLIVALRLIMPVGLESGFSLVPDIGDIRSGYTEVLFGKDDMGAADHSLGEDEYVPIDFEGKTSAYGSEEKTGSESTAKAPVTDVERPDIVSCDMEKADIERTDTEKSDIELPGIERTDIGLTKDNSKHADITGLLSIIYIAGCIVAFAYFLISIARLKRIVRFSVPAQLPYSLTEQSMAMIYVCEGIKSPFIMGMLGNRLYIPEGLDEETLKFVIWHENAHIRHFDQMWKMIGFVLLLIYWFNPLMWVAFICFTKDLELACDERAAGNLSPLERAGYSQALLTCSVHNRIIAICPLAFGETGVKERVKAIVSLKKPVKIVLVSVVLGCAVFAVCFLTDPVSAKEKDKDKDNNTDIILIDEGDTDNSVEDSKGAVDNIEENLEHNTIRETDDIDKSYVPETDNNINVGTGGEDSSTEEPPNKSDASVIDDNPISEDNPVVEDNSVKKDNPDVVDNPVIEDNSKKEEDVTPEINENETVISSTPSDEQAVIPSGIRQIKAEAFYNTKTIKSVIIPDTVEVIGRSAFSGCEKLENISIPSSVSTIEASAFQNCAIKSISIPESVTEISDYLFSGNRYLSKVVLEGAVTKIGNGAFMGCSSLKKIDIPGSVKEIGNSAFSNTGITEIQIPEGVEVISSNMFSGCDKLETVYLPSTIKTIDTYAFYNCVNLKSIYLPESVTTINDYAFYHCDNLLEINIPESVTEISRYAFWQCNMLLDESKDQIKAVNKKVRFDYVK